MPAVDPRQNLLWSTVAQHLEGGRGQDVALCSGERTVSYARLAAATERGAAEIDRRCAPGSRLLVAVRDQLRVGIALSAALHSRSLPLLADPTSADRLRALAAEWRVAAAIVEPGTELPGVDGIAAEAVTCWLEAAPAAAFAPRPVTPDEPAFWTFTSGSTGEPKAVVHAHRGPLAAYRGFAGGVLGLGPEDVTIATAGLPFVYALGNNFFFPLMAGAAAILPGDLLLPTVLGELARHGATVLVAGPWSLDGIVRLARRPRWLEGIRRLRCVLSAGEPLPPRVFAEWRARFGKEVLDNLGCTEMFNSFVSQRRGEARAGSLGFAVPGFELRVAGAPPAPGVRGALSVRGASRAVATGAGGETAPIAAGWCETGDEVEVGADGALRFLGRTDDRLKVKGRFLHPLEVERTLAAATGVRECLVVCEPDASGLPTVIAKVVAAPASAPGEVARRVLQLARERLEPFAVPRRVDLVAALPRGERGKLRRRDPPGT